MIDNWVFTTEGTEATEKQTLRDLRVLSDESFTC
jgi:hypothetical protein